jgi:amino acid transporter
MSLIDVLFGRPLASDEDHAQRVGVPSGIPIFGLDALGSAAYGPEAALTILLPLGLLSTQYVIPITLAIVGILAVVYFSYLQTIEAYPSGGGSYTVASKNLGTFPGLLAAAALMIDYILVVAVGVATGVGALVSAVPLLQPHTVLICLTILGVITLINLRGVREAGLFFMAPTYVFIFCLGVMVVVGIWRTLAFNGHPLPVVAPPSPLIPASGVGLWLLVRAFSSGCTAMTGVEAVSNGVPAFRDPSTKNARVTLTAIISILIVLLIGIAVLCKAYNVVATIPGRTGYESVLSQLLGAVFGKGLFYYICIASILLVLALQANTAFADFPRLCRTVAENGYLPSSFAERGRRLVYSQGIYVLAILAGLLLFVFQGITDRLIPLFAVGAFLAFTLSQAGMVSHWRRLRGRKAAHHIAVNGTGALVTGLTVAVVIVSKFDEGAWLTLLVIPAILITMYKVRRHYDRVSNEIAHSQPLSVDRLCPPLVVVPIERWSRIAERTLRFALTLSPDIIALHVDHGEHQENLHERWDELVVQPTRNAGVPTPDLVVLQSPYRLVVTWILRFVLELEKKHLARQIAVVVPEIVEKRWYQYFLHKQRGKMLSLALIFKGNQRISIINLPWHLDEEPAARPESVVESSKVSDEAA